jgi:hypothetical protein
MQYFLTIKTKIMANRKTKLARKMGFCSQKDMLSNGEKIFAGSCCYTSWDNKNSKKNGRKVYKKQQPND